MFFTPPSSPPAAPPMAANQPAAAPHGAKLSGASTSAVGGGSVQKRLQVRGACRAALGARTGPRARAPPAHPPPFTRTARTLQPALPLYCAPLQHELMQLMVRAAPRARGAAPAIPARPREPRLLGTTPPARSHACLPAPRAQMAGNKEVTAFPEEDNVFQWAGSIKGSVGSAYEGMTFKLRLSFPADYPFTAPKVTFVTPCWHPNVDAVGNICLDILKDKWTAAYSALTVLLSLQTLLGDPNNESPLNAQAAGQWADQASFRRVVVRKYREATGAAPTSGPLE